MSKTIPVCAVEELPPGGRRILEMDGKSIGIFNIAGKFYAIRNSCPHQFAPLCLGKISGTTLPGKVGEYNYAHDNEIIRCPWHGWEFHIPTGKSVFNPHKVRVRAYPVTVDKCSVSNDDELHVQVYTVTVEKQMIMLHL